MPYQPPVPPSLDLEIVGQTRALTPEDLEDRPPTPAPKLAKLRDSHHTLARLLAAGLTTEQASLQTGYTPTRIYTLKNDPTFQNLVAFYSRSREEARQELEAKYLLIGNDFAQHIHEQLLDEPEEIPLMQALEVFKAMTDRGGMGPTSRTLNKNINLNIGDRLDAARRRTTVTIDQPPNRTKSPWERGDE